MDMGCKREDWIDAAKGILIFLVVAGHAFGAASHLGSDSDSNLMLERVYKVIYFFHMPAFFILAGVTWSDGRKGFLPYLLKKMRRLLIPYVAFGLFSLIVEFALTRQVAYGRFLLGNGCAYNGPLWFLPCMFVCEMVYYWLQKVLKVTGLLSWVVVLAALFLGFCLHGRQIVDLPSWSVAVPVYLMFMILGQVLFPLSRWKAFAVHEKSLKACAWILVVLFACVGWFLPWEAECGRGFVPYVGYRGLAFVGASITIFLAQAVAMRPFVVLGMSTLGILALHKFPLSALQLKFAFFSRITGWESLVVTFVLSVFVTAACWWIIVIIRRYLPVLLGEMKGVVRN